MKKPSKEKLNFKNPIIAAQAHESPFVPDPFLGHTMPPGKDFIGEKEYIDLEELIDNIKSKKKQKQIILNIGDSSTSGWDSNIVTQNRKRIEQGLPLLPAFFQYKTYSDYLREIVGHEFLVINAGVPAHTSLQGSRRLKLLLKRFKKEKISIKYVTAYYGNNDSVWDHNRQDNEWVGQKKTKKASRNKNESIITRVSVSDYKKNMNEIISTCRNFNTNVLIIKPLTPLYWKPGTRVLNENLPRNNYPGSAKIYPLLDEALILWEKALKHDYSELKLTILQLVQEKDYIVPRIKKDHLTILNKLVQEKNISYIDIELDRSVDDIRYFIDYCHPIANANKLIANNIYEVISGRNTNKIKEINIHKKTFIQVKQKIEIPVAHYTLY